MRTVLSLAASQDLKLYSFDISNAYLQAELKEVIYMEPPPGMSIPADECLALMRPIYGTKQGGRMFSDALDAHLNSDSNKMLPIRVCGPEHEMGNRK